ncbi:MAG: hypothetical protein ACK5QT_08385 [Oligoflexia bacterium]
MKNPGRLTLAMVCLSLVPGAVFAAPSRLDEAITAALSGLKTELGQIAPWQKKIFDQEILPFGQDFVREQRLVSTASQSPSQSSIKIELDQALIRKALSFYAPQALSNAEPRVAARIEASEGCSVCTSAIEPLKKLIQARLENRGIRPVWIKDEEMPATPAQGTPPVLAKQLARVGFLRSLEISRSLQGSVLLRVESLVGLDSSPQGQGDAVHSEDAKFSLKMGISLGSWVSFKRVDFQATQPIDGLARRLWTEAMAEFTERGTFAASVHAAPSNLGTTPSEETWAPSEVLIHVTGVRDYFMLTALKSQLQLAVGELSPVIERVMSRGQVTLAIRTALGAAEVRSKISGISVGQQKLVLASGSADLPLEGELK